MEATDSDGLRQRAQKSSPKQEHANDTEGSAAEPHPGGRIKHGAAVQVLRALSFVSWFLCCCTTIVATQLLGCWLYFVNQDYYYAYMALTKQSFGILMATITQWFSPTLVRVSGDRSVTHQMKLTPDGRLETNFPERLVMIANHQLYAEWLYLWWIAYTSRMHGHLFIILKESLKYLPIFGLGMQFYGFIFMARNWAKDQLRMRHRLSKLKSRHSGPFSGTKALDPMWLLIFPEGTNLSANTKSNSAKWAEKVGMEDFEHQLVPRTTGLQYALSELGGSIDWVYDCTLAYEGIPKGGYGQDYFTLRSTYIQGRPPKSVNMYWRRFAVSSIPVNDPKAFEQWVMKMWREKDAILKYFAIHARFPPNESADSILAGAPESKTEALTDSQLNTGYIETEVKLAHWIEIGQIFVVLAALALVANVLVKFWNIIVDMRTAFA